MRVQRFHRHGIDDLVALEHDFSVWRDVDFAVVQGLQKFECRFITGCRDGVDRLDPGGEVI